MYQSNRSFNFPPGQTPRAFELLKVGLFKFPPLGVKSRSNAPPISSEIHLKDKFRLQSNTVHTFQREICHDDTFKLLFKTLLKELFANKGQILSCKSVKPCKNRKKKHRSISPEKEINPVQIPHPSKATFKFPPSRAQCTVKCPGFAGGVLKLQFDRYIIFSFFFSFFSIYLFTMSKRKPSEKSTILCICRRFSIFPGYYLRA